ncbi:hypothetical protein K8I31_21725, partial [bacterium]|nr:hypothetical protein [bacterium]
MDSSLAEKHEDFAQTGKSVDGLIDVPIQIDEDIQRMIHEALREDIRDGDVTTLATIEQEKPGSARVVV